MVRISDISSNLQKISDYDIIRILLRNSRKSFVEIADELKVTESAVRKRIRKMEKQGIIERYSIDINPEKLGFGMRIILGIDTSPQTYISTIQKLKGYEEILRVYASSGDHMIMLDCWIKDDVEYERFIKTINEIEGIKDICPAIINDIIK